MNSNLFMARPVFQRQTFQPPRPPELSRRPTLGRNYPALGDPKMGQSLGAILTTGVVGLALAAATAYVGIRAGTREKGIHSALGWITGLTAGVLGVNLGLGLLAVTLAAPSAPQSTTSEAAV